MIKYLAILALFTTACVNNSSSPLPGLLPMYRYEQPTVLPIEVKCAETATSTRFSNGTATRIGDAWVTAYHVVDGCSDVTPIKYSESLDIALLKEGYTGPCTKAHLGEEIYYEGFPSFKGPDIYLKYDMSIGLVTDFDVTVYMTNKDTGELEVIREIMDKGSQVSLLDDEGLVIEGVRGGYSGGRVFSDRGTLGVISSGNLKSVLWSNTPNICDFIKTEEPIIKIGDVEEYEPPYMSQPRMVAWPKDE